MIRMSDELCARCDNGLATSNHHKDRLCGACQRELGASRGAKSLSFREWIERGRKREIDRKASIHTPTGDAFASAIALDTKDLVDLIKRGTAELQRRRAEMEELLKLLPKGAAESERHEQKARRSEQSDRSGGGRGGFEEGEQGHAEGVTRSHGRT